MLILTHIGINLPNYLNTFLTQLRKFNPSIDITFLVNNVNLNDIVFQTHNIRTYPIEELNTDLVNSFILKFGHGDLNSFKKNVVYASSDYWCVTATRLFYIYEYSKKYNINEYFHFENDIMVYENILDILDIINKNGFIDKILMTRGTNNKIMTGFMYVNNNESMLHLLQEISSYLSNKNDLFRFGIDMINEMSLLHIYQVNNPDKLINFPILPFDDNFGLFNSIFDPATYGQYLDGTPSNPGVSLIPDSLIGDELRKDNTIRIEFFERIPFLIYKENKIKINSLHIHSKRLDLFS